MGSCSHYLQCRAKHDPERAKHFGAIAGIKGPDRVVVNRSGEAVSWNRAAREFTTIYWVILIRGDGWTLGAPKSLAQVAYDLWADQWIGWRLRRDSHVQPMSAWPHDGRFPE